MVMRYHWGHGVGHTYAHSETDALTSSPPSVLQQGLNHPTTYPDDQPWVHGREDDSGGSISHIQSMVGAIHPQPWNDNYDSDIGDGKLQDSCAWDDPGQSGSGSPPASDAEDSEYISDSSSEDAVNSYEGSEEYSDTEMLGDNESWD
jgi:hypothetical protein